MSQRDSRREEGFLQKMIFKAAWMIEEGRVVKISEFMYYITGKNSKHMVKRVDAELECTCQGYKKRELCSHVIAVSTLLNMKNGLDLVREKINERVEKELQEISDGRIGKVRR